MGFSGINALIDVTMAKVDNANNGDRPPRRRPRRLVPGSRFLVRLRPRLQLHLNRFFSYSPLKGDMRYSNWSDRSESCVIHCLHQAMRSWISGSNGLRAVVAEIFRNARDSVRTWRRLCSAKRIKTSYF